MKTTKRIVLGMTGASGVIYGIKCLEALKRSGEIETHLIISGSAEKTIAIETEYKLASILRLSDVVHEMHNIAASISSGSFITEGMIVCPCTMKTLSGIVSSYNDTLMIRAADVTLKERRKLIVVPRETPLHKGHLDMMVRLAELGGTILPPAPAFYHHPETIDDIINQTVGKILDQFGVHHNLFKRWEGTSSA